MRAKDARIKRKSSKVVAVYSPTTNLCGASVHWNWPGRVPGPFSSGSKATDPPSAKLESTIVAPYLGGAAVVVAVVTVVAVVLVMTITVVVVVVVAVVVLLPPLHTE